MLSHSSIRSAQQEAIEIDCLYKKKDFAGNLQSRLETFEYFSWPVTGGATLRAHRRKHWQYNFRE
jgi:hypothetical protein